MRLVSWFSVIACGNSSPRVYSIGRQIARERLGLPALLVRLRLSAEKREISEPQGEIQGEIDDGSANPPRLGLQHLQALREQDSRRYGRAEVRICRRPRARRRCDGLHAAHA